MGQKAEALADMPTAEQLRQELNREESKLRGRAALRGLVSLLLTVAAASVLIAMLWMPVLRIYGTSMLPGLMEGDVVVCVKTGTLKPGELAAFYVGNQLLVKRCIAGPGQWVDMDAEGNVFVDGKPLEEPYLTEKSFGECDLELPYQVPENRWFCMGDNRAVSLDSRHSSVGCVSREQLVGKLLLRVWPLYRFETLM